MWGPGVHLDRPRASPPTLWLIQCWAVGSTTLPLLWQPQPIATWQTSHVIYWSEWKRFLCVRAWLCANRQLGVVHDRRQQHYVSSTLEVKINLRRRTLFSSFIGRLVSCMYCVYQHGMISRSQKMIPWSHWRILPVFLSSVWTSFKLLAQTWSISIMNNLLKLWYQQRYL